MKIYETKQKMELFPVNTICNETDDGRHCFGGVFLEPHDTETNNAFTASCICVKCGEKTTEDVIICIGTTIE